MYYGDKYWDITDCRIFTKENSNKEFINKKAYLPIDTIDDFVEVFEHKDFYNGFPKSLKVYSFNVKFTSDFKKEITDNAEFDKLCEEKFSIHVNDKRNELVGKILEKVKIIENGETLYLELVPKAINKSNTFIKTAEIDENGLDIKGNLLFTLIRMAEYRLIVKSKTIRGINMVKYNINPFYLNDILFSEKVPYDKNWVGSDTSSLVFEDDGANLTINGYDSKNEGLLPCCTLNIRFGYRNFDKLTTHDNVFDEFNKYIESAFTEKPEGTDKINSFNKLVLERIQLKIDRKFYNERDCSDIIGVINPFVVFDKTVGENEVIIENSIVDKRNTIIWEL